MEWIKLIDREPQTWHLKPVRFIHTKMPILDIEKLLAERPNSTLSIVEWLDESTPSPSRGLQDRNFMVRLKANIDRRMKETGIKDVIYGDAFTSFIRSLEDITLETLQGKEPNPSPSTGFTVEEMEALALKRYCSPHGNANPETYAFIEGLKAASLPQSKVEGEEWVKVEQGNELPDYDVPVLWLLENGNMVVEALDKDGNPWIFEGQTFEGSYMGNKATHWRYLPEQPVNV